MHQPSRTGQMHSSQNPSIMYILGLCIAKNVVIWCASWYIHSLPTLVTLCCKCLMTFVPVGWADLALCHSCDHIIDNCNQDWSNKPLTYWYSNQPQTSLITCSLLLWPPAGLIFSCGVCVERATHPLHNNDGFCLHLPVFLLSASPAELQLFQCQPWRQRGALPHWHGEDDQVQDLSGLPAIVPPHLQLHSLPGTPGQPRRAHLKGTQVWTTTLLFCHPEGTVQL